jgi:hypothetical protein
MILLGSRTLRRHPMIVPAVSLAVIAGGILWLRTGRSPLVWLALGALALEAARRQAILSAREAARHFAEAWPEQHAEVRREVGR